MKTKNIYLFVLFISLSIKKSDALALEFVPTHHFAFVKNLVSLINLETLLIALILTCITLLFICIKLFLSIKKIRLKNIQHENFISQLTQHSNEVVCIINPSGIIENVSKNCHNLLGYEPNQIIGKSFFDFINTGEKDLVFGLEAGDKIILNVDKAEFRFRRQDNTFILVEAELNKLLSGNNQQFNIFINLRNVTALRISESRLFFSEFALDNVQQSVVMIDIEGNIVYLNAFTRKVLKRQRISITNLKIWNISSDVPKENWPEYFQFMRENKYKVIISEIKTPVGPIFLERHATYTEYKGKEYVITNMVDLTQHFKAEEKIRASEKRYRTIVENIYDVVWILDLKLNTTFITPSIERLTGFTVEEQLAQKIEKKFTPESYNKIKVWFDHYIPLINKGEIDKKNFMLRGELQYVRKDGSPVWVEMTIKLLLNEKDEFIGIHGTSVNIDERKKTEIEIRASREKYKSIFENIIDVYFETSLDGIVIEVSPSLEKFTKYKREEVLHTQLSKYYDSHESRGYFLQVLKKNQFVSNFDAKFVDKDGKILECSLTATLLKDENGNYYKICGTIRDISDKKKADRLIKESEERYKTLVDMSPNPIIVTRDDIIKYGNPEAIKYFNYQSIDELVEIKLLDLIDPKDKEKAREKLNNVNEYDTFQVTELNVIGRNHEKLTILASAKLISYQNKPAQLIVCQDITQHKKFADELIIAKQKAEESDKLKSAFLANMSHEIRTPLNGIIGFSDLIKKPSLEKSKFNKYTDIISTSSHQLLTIINDIIDISKIEAGQMQLYNDNTSVKNVIKEIYTIFKSQVEKKGIELKLEDKLPKEFSNIITDEIKLKQVLNNLINNALKFTEKGYIELGCELIDKKLRFWVADSGIGIPDQYQQIVFERFRQVEIANNRKYGGTGLGLSISKALVEMLGGEIGYKSNEKKGSVFSFTIPCVYSKKNSNQQSNLTEESLSKFNWNNKTILVVEDETSNAFFIEELLEETGASIIVASNGKEAIEYFRAEPTIDIVLLDIKMPGIDGFDVFKELRGIDPSVKVIAQTAYAMSNDKEKVLKLGFNDYISKPINSLDLLNTINQYM